MQIIGTGMSMAHRHGVPAATLVAAALVLSID